MNYFGRAEILPGRASDERNGRNAEIQNNKSYIHNIN
jgi:hypothetical protein